MTDLDQKEQKHVRIALHYLRRQIGAWTSVADALQFKRDTVNKVAIGRIAVSASMALRVARLVGVPMDDLLAGHFLPGACPRCGYMPDFADEETVVGDVPSPAPGGGLKVVK